MIRPGAERQSPAVISSAKQELVLISPSDAAAVHVPRLLYAGEAVGRTSPGRQPMCSVAASWTTFVVSASLGRRLENRAEVFADRGTSSGTEWEQNAGKHGKTCYTYDHVSH